MVSMLRVLAIINHQDAFGVNLIPKHICKKVSIRSATRKDFFAEFCCINSKTPSLCQNMDLYIKLQAFCVTVLKLVSGQHLQC